MKINPLKDSILTGNSAGIGTVTREIVRKRAAESALIDSRLRGQADLQPYDSGSFRLIKGAP
jgi:hypothetical protein